MLQTVLVVEDLSGTFDSHTRGVRVLNESDFRVALEEAIAAYRPTEDDIPGELIITLPPETHTMVSGDVGRHPESTSNCHRLSFGDPDLYYLDRRFAAPVTRCDVVVFSKEAYLTYLQFILDIDEWEAVNDLDCTHVLLDILTYCEGYSFPPLPKKVARALALDEFDVVDEWKREVLDSLEREDALRICRELKTEWDPVADREFTKLTLSDTQEDPDQ